MICCNNAIGFFKKNHPYFCAYLLKINNIDFNIRDVFYAVFISPHYFLYVACAKNTLK